MLPGLFKNNFLEEPVLALVKSVDCIDEICQKLKKTYGDPRILLSKK